MLNSVRVAALSAVVAASLGAQQPARPMTRADSIEKARQDSIALVRALEAATASPSAAQQPGQPGPINPRLLPDFSAVGDLVGDLSPKGSTQADKTRFGVREVELAVQAAVDPYFRGDVFLGISDLEKISIEQAFLTATALPYGLEARLGRYLMPFGKQNTTHRHDLHTVEYPYIIQKFLSDDGLKGTGVYASEVFAPMGFYQELIVTAVDRLGDKPEGLVAAEPANKDLSGMGVSARLRNYWDFSESTNLELSGSAITGRREQPLVGPFADSVNAVNARQSLFGGDFTFRWRPLQQGLYQSFILQGEFMRQVNQKIIASNYAGPDRDYNGAYVFARYQLSQRLFLGGRYDWVQDPEANGATFNAGSGYLEWFPSEFSKLVAAYEARSPSGHQVEHRILLQASFALGPHKPHPF